MGVNWVDNGYVHESEERNPDWNVAEAVRQMYLMEEEPSWGMDWYADNAPGYAKGLRQYAIENMDKLHQEVNRHKILEIYYSLCRSTMNKRVAICYAIGLNCSYEEPLDNREFYDVIKVAETAKLKKEDKKISVKKGEPWEPKKISLETGISLAILKEYKVGIREFFRQEKKRKHDIKDKKEARIEELLTTTDLSTYEISDVLISEGYRKGVGERTVRNYKNDLIKKGILKK